MSFKYTPGRRSHSCLAEPTWIQGPKGIWGWAIREEEFELGLYSPTVPWTMYYYLNDHREVEVLEEATVNMTILVDKEGLDADWLGPAGTVLWELLKPEEGSAPLIGCSPLRMHKKHPKASHPRTLEWNTLLLSDMKDGWLKTTLMKGADKIAGDPIPCRVPSCRQCMTPIIESRDYRPVNRAGDLKRGLFEMDEWEPESAEQNDPLPHHLPNEYTMLETIIGNSY